MGVLARPKAISVAPTLNLIPRVETLFELMDDAEDDVLTRYEA